MDREEEGLQTKGLVVSSVQESDLKAQWVSGRMAQGHSMGYESLGFSGMVRLDDYKVQAYNRVGLGLGFLETMSIPQGIKTTQTNPSEPTFIFQYYFLPLKIIVYSPMAVRSQFPGLSSKSNKSMLSLLGTDIRSLMRFREPTSLISDTQYNTLSRWIIFQEVFFT